jgi:hypothetical protein
MAAKRKLGVIEDAVRQRPAPPPMWTPLGLTDLPFDDEGRAAMAPAYRGDPRMMPTRIPVPTRKERRKR